MESEQLKRLRRGFGSWNRGDWEATLEDLSPEVVWQPGTFFAGVEPRYDGYEEVRRFFRDFVDPWVEVSIELEDLIDERPGQVLIRALFSARGRHGIEVEGVFFQIYRFDDEGLVSWFQAFEDEAEARREAGLEG